MENPFVRELLSLQQDGKNAISAPTNWLEIPLLEVSTSIDATIDELFEQVLRRSNNHTAIWHFFIGSPGNGKSAAIGKLVRKLYAEKACYICDEKGTPIDKISKRDIPYEIQIFEIHEGSQDNYASAKIIQDASVVSNPFDPDADPASSLCSVLEDAWDHGLSLVVCTNRGIIEKAFRDVHIDTQKNTTEWFKVLKGITEQRPLKGLQFTGKKRVFQTLNVSYSHLDNRSLLLHSNTFSQLIENAVEAQKWACCIDCGNQEYCPFHSNMLWLGDPDGKRKILSLLTKAEILSTQVIVFREAIALISFILAGCPQDYQGSNPCDWVSRMIEEGDFFALCTRRIYMCLFSSYAPYGLETDLSLQRKQLQALSEMYCANNDEDNTHLTALKHVIAENRHPSTDVGVKRILGMNGCISKLDIWNEPIPVDFYDIWDVRTMENYQHSLYKSIDKHCVNLWRKLIGKIEHEMGYHKPEHYSAIVRWSSNFLLHFGALLDGMTSWSTELKEFADLLELVPQKETINKEQRRKKRELEEQINHVLTSEKSQNGASSVQLSPNVLLHGNWVRSSLKPEVEQSSDSGNVALSICFNGNEHSVLAAPMYIWLKLKANGNLDSRCFPPEVIAGANDARIRAAARSSYSTQDKDIELIVRDDANSKFKITRYDVDDIEVEHV